MRLYLLRHGEVNSHRGDVLITDDAVEQAGDAGLALGRREPGTVLILSGETRRTVDTASHIAKGMVEAGARIIGPRVAFALRNPDLYLAGTRVNMVSSAEALAEQVQGLSADDVARVDFFPEFFAAPDRIGWWMAHDSPPGEDRKAIANRIRSFIASLADPIPGRPDAVVAVTHSPLVRIAGLELLGKDMGEPPWVSGLLIEVDRVGGMSASLFTEETS